jgi:acyl-CoA synthetase (AMP-forming)/AMP-acid ligase II
MDNTFLTRLSRPQIEAYYAAGLWGRETIYRRAQKHARRSPDRMAVRGTWGALTYSQLIVAADRLADRFAGAGICKGGRIAVWLPNRPEVAVAVLACSKAGLVVAPSLHRTHTVSETLHLLEMTRASALIGEVGYGADGHLENIFERARLLPTVKLSIELTPSGPLDDELFAEGGIEGASPTVDDPDSVVYLALTSGTTGRSKGVLHSDNTLLANARALAGDWSIGPDSVVYSFSPVSHNLGFGAMIMALSSGSEFVMHDAPRGSPVAGRLRQTGATFVVGVPTHALDLVAELESGSEPVTTVKGFRLSGASGAREVVRSLARHGIVPQSGYGMTEAGSHHYTLPTDDISTIVETSGKACGGFEARAFAIDDADRQLPAGEVGQIGSRGASMMLGYYDDQAATEDAFNSDGWFMTGDLGSIDGRGYIRISGRIKDIIVRGGHNIHPTRIEDLAMRHASVAMAAAIPIPDQRLGERVCLTVATVDGHTLSSPELLSHLQSEGLSRYDMPEFVLFTDTLPVTASGKILKRSLVASVRSGELVPEPV